MLDKIWKDEDFKQIKNEPLNIPERNLIELDRVVDGEGSEIKINIIFYNTQNKVLMYSRIDDYGFPNFSVLTGLSVLTDDVSSLKKNAKTIWKYIIKIRGNVKCASISPLNGFFCGRSFGNECFLRWSPWNLHDLISLNIEQTYSWVIKRIE